MEEPPRRHARAAGSSISPVPTSRCSSRRRPRSRSGSSSAAAWRRTCVARGRRRRRRPVGRLARPPGATRGSCLAPRASRYPARSRSGCRVGDCPRRGGHRLRRAPEPARRAKFPSGRESPLGSWRVIPPGHFPAPARTAETRAAAARSCRSTAIRRTRPAAVSTASCAAPSRSFACACAGRPRTSVSPSSSGDARYASSRESCFARDENRQAGPTALPLNTNPYLPTFFEPSPVSAVIRPTPGTYHVVFDSTTRAGAGRSRSASGSATRLRLGFACSRVRSGAEGRSHSSPPMPERASTRDRSSPGWPAPGARPRTRQRATA